MRTYLQRVFIAAVPAFLITQGCQSRSSTETGVATPSTASGKSGSNVAERTPVSIASLPNLRDVGGHVTRDGAVVRRGLLYRSGQLYRVPAADLETLAGLGVVCSYDLRTAGERAARPDALAPGMRLVALDVLADADAASTGKLSDIVRNPKRVSNHPGGNTGEATELMVQSYREFVTLPSARKAYGALFTQIAQESGTPALFHCSTGKDRGGWAAAALLTFLGVPEDEVMRDFLASNDATLPAYGKTADAFVAAGGEVGVFPAVMGVKAEYPRAALDEVKRRYGSIEAYFSEGLGIDAAGQAALKKKFLQR